MRNALATILPILVACNATPIARTHSLPQEEQRVSSLSWGYFAPIQELRMDWTAICRELPWGAPPECKSKISDPKPSPERCLEVLHSLENCSVSFGTYVRCREAILSAPCRQLPAVCLPLHKCAKGGALLAEEKAKEPA